MNPQNSPTPPTPETRGADTHTAGAQTSGARAGRFPRVPFVIRLVVVMAGDIAAYGLLMGVTALLGMLASPQVLDQINNGPLGLVISPVLYAIVAAGAVVVVWQVMKRLEGRPLAQAGWVFTRASLPLFVLGVVISVAITVPASAILDAQGLLRPAESSMDTWGEFFRYMPHWMGLALILQGFPEEFIFRGWLMQSLRHRPMLALAVSSLVFGAIHIVSQSGAHSGGEQAIYMVHAAAFGACAGALLLATRSVWTAVGIHTGLHIAFAMIEPMGIGTGPVEWVIGAVLYLLVAAVALAVWRRSGATQVVIDR